MIRQVRGNNKVGSQTVTRERGESYVVEKKKIVRVQDRDITPFSRNSIPLEFRLGGG